MYLLNIYLNFFFLAEIFKNIFLGILKPNYKQMFFTSHLDVTLNNNYISCTTGIKTPSEAWAVNEPKIRLRIEACVAFSTREKEGKGLIPVGCFELNGFMCEVLSLFKSFLSNQYLHL
jgi:hypothetical protein